MPAQIVWAEFEAHQLTGFDHLRSGCFIENREDPTNAISLLFSTAT